MAAGHAVWACIATALGGFCGRMGVFLLPSRFCASVWRDLIFGNKQKSFLLIFPLLRGVDIRRPQIFVGAWVFVWRLVSGNLAQKSLQLISLHDSLFNPGLVKRMAVGAGPTRQLLAFRFVTYDL
jgi:hypothetical protein